MTEQNTDHLTRQLDIIPLDRLNEKITIIGAGAIGSFVALSLVKMGFRNLEVWDFDRVSVENMNCQWYRMRDIGKPKVVALQELLFEFTGTNVLTKYAKWSGAPVKGIIISAVDSMAVRKEIWQHCKDNLAVKWLIDPRMAAEYALSFVMDPNDSADQSSYEKTLYSDESAVNEPCTAKATMYTATMIAGYVAKHVKDIVTESPYARVTHWNIGTNHYLSWKKAEVKT